MLTQEFRQKVRKAVLKNKDNFPSISDKVYAKTIGLSASIYSQLKSGKTERLVADTFWIEQGRKLNVSIYERTWNVARTSVYTEIENNILFCKKYKKATILIDECGIGKTFCTKRVIKDLPNAYYVDCSQAKTKSRFIRLLAKTIMGDDTGKLGDLKDNLKYFINQLENPFIALDDAGYLATNTLVEIIEIWNATEKHCGWMIIGDDSLQSKMERGLRSKKIGFKALFSRFSDEFIHYVPTGLADKREFYRELVGDVASVNIKDATKVNKFIKLCIGKEKTLRHLETLIELDKANE